jgi:hypothetical protein
MKRCVISSWVGWNGKSPTYRRFDMMIPSAAGWTPPP